MTAAFHTDLSTLRKQPDVVIAGGGIVGLATAFFLSRLGVRPLLLERLPGVTMLASNRSGEGVRAQWEKAENIEIARASIAFYRDFENFTGVGAGYRPIGYLYGSRSEEGRERLRARVARQQAAGLDDVRFLTPEEMRDLTPTVAPDVSGGAIRQADGVIEVDRVIAGYLDAMEADIVTGAEMTRVEPRHTGVLLHTNFGRIETGKLILCTAARLGASLTALNLVLPMRLARSTIQYVRHAGVPFDHPAMVDADLGSFWRPDYGGARMTASFRSTLFLDHFTDDPAVDPDYLAAAIASVAPLIPFWNETRGMIRGGHLRTGSLLVTADGGPMIGPLAQDERIVLNTGYGGHGLMMSPEGARRAALMAAGGFAGDNPFTPARFADPDNMPTPEPMTVNLASDRDTSKQEAK